MVEGVEVGHGRVVESLCRLSDAAKAEEPEAAGPETLRFTARVAAAKQALL